MRYALYQDPQTLNFAFLALPKRFVDGDELPVVAVEQWFGSREEAVAALGELLNREESDSPPVVLS